MDIEILLDKERKKRKPLTTETQRHREKAEERKQKPMNLLLRWQIPHRLG
jgi:hypothetical protein